MEDQGPGTKFLPLLHSLLTLASLPPSSSESSSSSPPAPSSSSYLNQPLLILDDDHIYSPHLLSTLLLAHRSKLYPPNAVLGLRGWTIREDLGWGVSGSKEYQRHVVEGWRLKKRYRVGGLTANEGYLITPSHFVPSQYLAGNPTDPPPLYPSLAPILNYTNAPASARFVDDIWISHHLSFQHHPRYLIPFPHPLSLDITGSQPSQHTLETHLSRSSLSRAQANDQVLRWGEKVWRREIEGWEETSDRGEGEGEGEVEGEDKREGKLDWFVMMENGGGTRVGLKLGEEPDWIGGGKWVWRRVGKWVKGWRERVGCLVRRGRWIVWS